MKTVYPIILSKDGKWVVVDIPDMQINTQGKDWADAIAMARDAICLAAITREDMGQAVPPPSEITSIQANEGEFATLVDVDFAEYRRKSNSRTVRRTVSLPEWLNTEVEKNGINASYLLQTAIKRELGI